MPLGCWLTTLFRNASLLLFPGLGLALQGYKTVGEFEYYGVVLKVKYCSLSNQDSFDPID